MLIVLSVKVKLMARAKTGPSSVMSDKDAVKILKKNKFKPREPFHAKMTPWLMECLVCHNIFKRRLRDLMDGYGCKFCNGKAWNAEKARKRMQDAGLNPLEKFKNSQTKWKVKCVKCDKVSYVALRNIVSGSIKGCANCAKLKKQDFDNKQVEIFEKIQKLDFTILEGQTYQGKRIPLEVKCNLCDTKSKFYTSYFTQKEMTRGCKTCANNRLKLDKHIIIERFKRANIRPLEEVNKASRKVKYVCLVCGFKGKCSASSIRKGKGCFRCGKDRGGKKRRIDFATVKRDFEKYDLRVISAYISNNSPLECICKKCKRSIFKSYGSLLRNKNGCPYCSNDRVDPIEAIHAIRKRGFEPLEAFPGGKKRWKCTCKSCKRISYPTHVSKSQVGSGCGYCSQNRVDPLEAVKFMKSRDIEPLEPYKGASIKWSCRCNKCNREILTSYSTIKNGSGCKFCAIQGLDLKSPAFIYLIVNEELNSLKIGIGSQELRIRQHTSLGWKLVKRWNFRTGYKASDIEEKVLTYLRNDLNLTYYLSKEQMPQKGHTETFGLDDIDILTVQNIIQKLSRDKIIPKIYT